MSTQKDEFQERKKRGRTDILLVLQNDHIHSRIIIRREIFTTINQPHVLEEGARRHKQHPSTLSSPFSSIRMLQTQFCKRTATSAAVTATNTLLLLSFRGSDTRRTKQRELYRKGI